MIWIHYGLQRLFDLLMTSVFGPAKILRLCHFRSTSFFFFYIHYFDPFYYSFPPFFETETISSVLSIFSETMSSSNEIQPNRTSIALRGRACFCCRGRTKACGCDRRQRCQEPQRTLFQTALRSSTGSINRSRAQKSVPTLDAAPLSQTPVVLSPPAPSAPSRRRSQTELVQVASGTKEV